MGIPGGKFSVEDDFSLSEVFRHSLKYVWDGRKKKKTTYSYFPIAGPTPQSFLKMMVYAILIRLCFQTSDHGQGNLYSVAHSI